MKIFLDSGDPSETKEILNLLGQIDGQTTNPTLITRNPEAKARIERGDKFSQKEVMDFYKKIVTEISNLIPNGSVSIEVYVDANTSVEQIVKQAENMYKWIPNAHIKIPITKNGLEAAELLTKKGIRLNLTLCFTQTQAAAVYSATRGAKPGDVFISPFLGRWDDKGFNGIDLVINILKMYAKGDGHVQILSASLRNLDHLLDTFKIKSDLATVPYKILKEWIEAGKNIPNEKYINKNQDLKKIPYQELDLNKNWQKFDIQHELTDIGLSRFVEDWNNIII